MIKVGFQMRGLLDIQARLRALADAGTITKELAAKLYQRGTKILNVSLRLVPVDKGTLRSTGTVFIPVISGNRVSCEIGYGGPAAEYAFIVHEDLEAEHPVGQAKYLEIPFLSEKDGYLDDLKELVTKILRDNRQAFKEAA